MKDGMYFSITVVKNGTAYQMPMQPVAELVPVLIDAICYTGVDGAAEVVKRIGGEGKL